MTDLQTAQKLASQLIEIVGPACERIQIAGSVRRQRPQVSDIEVVCIAQQQAAHGSIVDMFSGETESESALETTLPQALVSYDGLLRLAADKPRNGPKYKRLEIFYANEGGPKWLPIDLFIVQPDSWGYQLVIRTGPASLSKYMVTSSSMFGPLPPNVRCQGGQVLEAGRPLPMPEESDFFELCGLSKFATLPASEREKWLTWVKDSFTR